MKFDENEKGSKATVTLKPVPVTVWGETVIIYVPTYWTDSETDKIVRGVIKSAKKTQNVHGLDMDQMMRKVRKDAEKRRENLIDSGDEWLRSQGTVLAGEKVVLPAGGLRELKGNSSTARENRAKIRAVASRFRGSSVGKFFLWARSEGYDLNDVALYVDSIGDTALYNLLHDEP